MVNHPLDDVSEHYLGRALSLPAPLQSTRSSAQIDLLVARSLKAMHLVQDELTRAVVKFGPQRSAHEGYAVLLEEVDELWDEIKKNDKLRSKAKMLAEAKQVAAMALRFMIDVCGDELGVDEQGDFVEAKQVAPMAAQFMGDFAGRRVMERRVGQRRKVSELRGEFMRTERRRFVGTGYLPFERRQPAERRKP